MNASKSSTDPVKCVKAEKLKQDECRGPVNTTQGSVQGSVNAIQVNATRGPVNAIRGPANVTRGLVNARRLLVNATEGSDECKAWPSQLSPTTATAAPCNKPGVHKGRGQILLTTY